MRSSIVHEAVPPTSVICVQPRMPAVPSRKSTVPVGVPLGYESVAVNVTGCSKFEGLTDDVSTIEGGALFTVCRIETKLPA